MARSWARSARRAQPPTRTPRSPPQVLPPPPRNSGGFSGRLPAATTTAAAERGLVTKASSASTESPHPEGGLVSLLRNRTGRSSRPSDAASRARRGARRGLFMPAHVCSLHDARSAGGNITLKVRPHLQCGRKVAGARCDEAAGPFHQGKLGGGRVL